MRSLSILMIFFAAFFLSCSTTVPDADMHFQLIPASESGIRFENHVDENELNYVAHFQYVYNGGGVSIGDINNDGLSDIYFTGNEVLNKLYLNQGDLNFKDITGQSGVDGGNGWHNGVNMIDINADGLLDIYICRGGWKDRETDRENLLFINNGDLSFSEKASEYGLADPGYSIQAAFLDIDNDSDLDVYICNRPELFYLSNEEVAAGEADNHDWYRDKLFRNDDGKFIEIGIEAGIKNNYGYGLGVAVADVNNDGYSDIYVTNDYAQHDYLYVNKGDGTFEQKINEVTNHISFYSMGLDIMDINNDGYEDIFTLDMLPEDYIRSKTTMASMNVEAYNELIDRGYHYQYMHNMLQLNRGNGFFSEVGQLSGMDKTDWSWACLMSDFDLDGHKDVFITNGYRRDVTDKDATLKFQAYLNTDSVQQRSPQENVEHILSLYASQRLPNYLFHNQQNLNFQNVAHDWGLDQPSFSNGAAIGDLDNDGDLDIVVNNLEDEAFLYENKAEGTKNNYLKIHLIGPSNNPSGLGAKVSVSTLENHQFQQMKTTRGYLSSMDHILHFGLGQALKILEIKVVWPDGRENIIQHAKANRLLQINYKDARESNNNSELKQAIFKEQTANNLLPQFIHKENLYDDYKNQVLLPHRYSKLGPFLSKGDLNSDGLEDFFVGGAAQQSGAIYLQDEKGHFHPKYQPLLLKDKHFEDMGSLFTDIDNDGDLDLYVVSGGNEFSSNSANYQDRLYLNDGAGEFNQRADLPMIRASGSCVTAHDFDEDGDLDLFIGGRIVPDKYPYPARSYLLENDNGQLIDVTDDLASDMSNIGLVTDAVWKDINNDQIKELIIVGEWMPITIFEYIAGKFNNITAAYNLQDTKGWWNTIEAADLDGDGDMDFVLGNLGTNYKFKATEEKPFSIYADDFDKNGTNDIFLAKNNKGTLVPIRGKECSAQQLPEIKDNFKSYKAFAHADLGSILGNRMETALRYEAKMFESIILRNDGSNFLIEPLPIEAQFSCIQGICLEDLNGDGYPDYILGGNNFSVEIETSRADASLGQVILNGSDHLDILNPATSGLSIPSDVKDLLAIKLADESLAILVTSNNGPLQFFSTSSSLQL